MRPAVIAFTRRGAELGEKLARALDGTLYVPDRFAGEVGAQPCGPLSEWTARMWAGTDALIFVGATGIAVRAIAPQVKDKLTDPAVVSVDEEGRFVIPLLSGHVGGANELARRVAEWLGIETMDPTTYEVARLMYWPTCSSDGTYVFRSQEGPVLRVRDVLDTYGYGDAWRDSTLWPISKTENEIRLRSMRTERTAESGMNFRWSAFPDRFE